MESRFINGVRCRHGLRVPDRAPGVCFDKVVLLVGGKNEHITNYRINPDASRHGSAARDPGIIRGASDLQGPERTSGR